MDEMQFLGYAVTAIITLSAFIVVIQRFTQPINELRIAIQKLIDNIDAIKNDNQTHTKQIEEHGKAITRIDNRVGKIELKMDMYHKEDQQ